MTNCKIKVGDIFNTRVRGGWEKWTLIGADPSENDIVLSFVGRTKDGEPDLSRTGTLFFASCFKYDPKNGEYYEIKK